MATATETVSKPTNEQIKTFAMTIAAACIEKLGLKDKYRVAVRWYAAPCPMEFVEIGVTPVSKPVETHEFSVCLPASHFVCETKEDRSALAQYIFRIIQQGMNKWESK